MIKTLLKKQFLAFAAALVQGKDGKRRSKVSVLGVSVLMLIAFGSMAVLFYLMADMLCEPLVLQGLSWVYFAFVGVIATALGIIASLFTAKTSLYEAKDNDLLFSMPIPSWLVLFSRILGLYLLTLLFEAFVFLPATVCYLVTAGFSIVTLLVSLLVILVAPFGGLAICCVLGWLLALLAAKLPLKNILSVILAVGVFVGYMFVESKINEYLTYIVANGGVVAEKMKTLFFPFWKMGLACTGDYLALGVYLLLFLAPFALVYFLLAKTYLYLATANRGAKKAKYKSKEGKQGHPFLALLKKEAMRFTKNPMVALNCFLGTAFLIALPVLALFTGELREALLQVDMDEIVAMIVAAILAVTASMNVISASAVSLEGESVWIVRSLPVPTEKILLAKVAFHLLVTAIPAALAGIFFGIYYQMGVYALFVVAIGVLFSAYCALFGLVINLKMPNLHWTNEVVAVKQGFAALLSMLAEWAALALLVGGYFLFGKYLFAGGYFLVCISLLAAANGLLLVWICRRGTKAFEKL